MAKERDAAQAATTIAVEPVTAVVEKSMAEAEAEIKAHIKSAGVRQRTNRDPDPECDWLVKYGDKTYTVRAPTARDAWARFCDANQKLQYPSPKLAEVTRAVA